MSAPDIPLLIASENARSERRISPSWTISHLKDRLEPITGIPSTAQRLTLKVASWPEQVLTSENEEATQLSNFPLQAYAEIYVSVTIPFSSFMFSHRFLPNKSHIGKTEYPYAGRYQKRMTSTRCLRTCCLMQGDSVTSSMSHSEPSQCMSVALARYQAFILWHKYNGRGTSRVLVSVTAI